MQSPLEVQVPESTAQPSKDILSEDAARRLFASLTSSETDNDSALPHLPGYILKRRVARGGSSTVYLGFRDGSDRPLAIKIHEVPLGEGSDGARRARRELDLMMSLRLPSLPRVIDFGIHAGRLFIATEFIEGQRLDGAAESLSRRQRVELLAKVADAVQQLHEHGIIHRDLKPANILVDSHGDPIIIDLGIAGLLVSASETLTLAGSALGSPAFMAPEQARGEQTSIRTDIYGLGASAYVLLVGNPPHDTDGRVDETIRRVATIPARDPRALDPTFPKPLAAVLRKSVAVRAEDRYASAAELAQDLRRWLAGEAVQARGAGPLALIVLTVVRRPLLATAAVCIAMLAATLLGSIAAAVWMHSRPSSLVISPNGHTAELRSRSGATLKTWNASPGAARFAYGELIPRAAAPGNRNTIALWEKARPSASDLSGRLTLIDVDRNWRVLWQTPVEGITVPPKIRSADQPRDPLFSVGSVRRVDVFPSYPGDEFVITLNNNTYSPSSIRIYSHKGDLLHERWHDGWIYDTRWLPKSRRLVCAGVNSQATWEERGFGRHGGSVVVIFAIDPSLQLASPSHIELLDAESELAPIWYRWLMPPWSSAILGDAQLSAPRASQHPDAFELRIPAKDPSAAVLIDFLPDGRTDGPWILDDEFKRLFPELAKLPQGGMYFLDSPPAPEPIPATSPGFLQSPPMPAPPQR